MIKSFSEIKINDVSLREKFPDVWNYLETIRIEGNEDKLDVCDFKLNYDNNVFPEEVLFQEGDTIEVFVGIEDDITGMESVFDGTIKTIAPEFSNTLTVNVQAFEDLFKMDYSEMPVEIKKSATSMVKDQFESLVDKGKDFLSDLFGKDESGKQKYPSLKNIAEKFKEKYPSLIKEIVVDEPEFSIEEKLIKPAGQSDYKFLIDIAKSYNRSVSLRKGVLKIVKHRVKSKNTLIYNPSANYIVSGNSFVIANARFRTTVKNLTDKVKVVSGTRVGKGVLIESVDAEELIDTKTEPYEQMMSMLETRKKAMDSQLQEQGESFRNRYNNFIQNEYTLAKDNLKSQIDRIVDKIQNNKKYYYEVMAKLQNGERVKVTTKHEMISEENAAAWAKSFLSMQSRGFVKGTIYLQNGNNIFRPYQKVDLIFVNCGVYGVRFSGEYNINQTIMDIGKHGFNTTLKIDRNYIIDA